MSDQLALLWRKHDPVESERAGRSTDRARTRALILQVLPGIEPATDDEIISACRQVAPVSDSGVRSRRVELERDGLVVKAGDAKTDSGRACRTWRCA